MSRASFTLNSSKHNNRNAHISMQQQIYNLKMLEISQRYREYLHFKDQLEKLSNNNSDNIVSNIAIDNKTADIDDNKTADIDDNISLIINELESNYKDDEEDEEEEEDDEEEEEDDEEEEEDDDEEEEEDDDEEEEKEEYNIENTINNETTSSNEIKQEGSSNEIKQEGSSNEVQKKRKFNTDKIKTIIETTDNTNFFYKYAKNKLDEKITKFDNILNSDKIVVKTLLKVFKINKNNISNILNPEKPVIKNLLKILNVDK
jgi:U3 small nucleolar RNA-associated protein 3